MSGRLPRAGSWTRGGPESRPFPAEVDVLVLGSGIAGVTAQAGRDDNFGRGESYYDRYFSDPTNRPNPNLGPVSSAPFYAVPVYPGDVGTAGGLLCDEHARVLREDGATIEGLYAAGNTAASPMGPTYPGPGASIGAAAAFGYIAADHAATL